MRLSPLSPLPTGILTVFPGIIFSTGSPTTSIGLLLLSNQLFFRINEVLFYVLLLVNLHFALKFSHGNVFLEIVDN